jgi:hypothetical protein
MIFCMVRGREKENSCIRAADRKNSVLRGHRPLYSDHDSNKVVTGLFVLDRSPRVITDCSKLTSDNSQKGVRERRRIGL